MHREAAKRLVNSAISVDDAAVCRIAGITQADLDSARTVMSAVEGSKDMLSRMMVMAAMMPARQEKTSKIADRPATRKHGMLPGMSPEKALEMARKMGADEEALKKMEAAIKSK